MRSRAVNPRIWISVVLIALVTPLWCGHAAADRRVALVIGNSKYQNTAQLDNPRNDATLMADTLRTLGFALVGGGAQLDLNKASLDKAVQSFGRQIQGADVTLFYYAGHGVQVNGANYLIPVDANVTREADVDFQMLDVNKVLHQMDGSGTRLNMVILDACRNNPFGGRGLRSADGGLASMRAPKGTLISYATQPGNVAQDGVNGHSPFTEALASVVREPGLDIFATFNEVGLTVERATNGAQQPWVSSSPIDGKFYFAAPAALPGPQAAVISPPPIIETLHNDPDRIPIKDMALLREVHDRLYELNFDPESPDSKDGMKAAIAKFQAKAKLSPTGEPTLGLLSRLQKMDDLKPWGSIVFNPSTADYAQAWGYPTRKAAVEAARANCHSGKCEKELSFYGTNCGAVAVSDNSWALIQGESAQRAKDAALDECGKSGKLCRAVALCADGPRH
jgi:hypothetical protein